MANKAPQDQPSPRKRRARKQRGELCSQCGEPFSARACGVSHAILAAERGVMGAEGVDYLVPPPREEYDRLRADNAELIETVKELVGVVVLFRSRPDIPPLTDVAAKGAVDAAAALLARLAKESQ